MSYDQSKVAFVDTETTGLDPEFDYVWEIAVIVDGVETAWQQRLPGTTRDRVQRGGHCWEDGVSDWVLENTGIRERYDHDNALTPADSIDQFANLVYGRHLVGACPWFDSERLHRVNLAHYGAESENRDLPWHYHLIDVENLAMGYIAGLQAGGRTLVLRDGKIEGLYDSSMDETYLNWKPWAPELPWDSSALSKLIGVDPADFEPKHSALADARWAKAMYESIIGAPQPTTKETQ